MGMMVVMARGAQAISRATSCHRSRLHDELECHACDMNRRSSDGDLERVSFDARQLG
jgi:hypothetical protein